MDHDHTVPGGFDYVKAARAESMGFPGRRQGNALLSGRFIRGPQGRRAGGALRRRVSSHETQVWEEARGKARRKIAWAPEGPGKGDLKIEAVDNINKD